MVDVREQHTGARGRVITYPVALRAARRRFLASGGLAMEQLTEDLWVSRATLYRVVGSRDRLLGDVLWQLAARTLDLARAAADGAGLRGVERLLDVARRFDDEVGEFEPLQKYLAVDPGDATRILFGATAGVHVRNVEAWVALLRRELDAGEIDSLPFSVPETAFAFVRIGESIVYGSMLAGIQPDRRLGEDLRRTVLLSR
ncbi:QsdR family transcriptional regulator [Isoptericola aurantiacus]|uniref:QsdR family transcriptional regulator n=1 Tax=Isoptericola aurantiacus TaxID=3377839 RepID=UPI003839FA44